jgi:hypothetical protein
MTDIVERLKKHAGGLCTENPADYSTWVSKDVIIDAIKEIESLRKKCEKLEDELAYIRSIGDDV